MVELSLASRAVPKLRGTAEFLWRHPWLPKFVAAVACLALLLALLLQSGMVIILVCAGVTLLALYVLGYSDHAFRQGFRTLPHLKRNQYAEVWDSLSSSRELACDAACGERDEAEVRRSVETCLGNIVTLLRISRQDEVLEIGCGVGRVGRELAPMCKSWTGSDISANMLAHARDRMKGIGNAKFVQLTVGGLGEFEDASFDAVFATNMLGHLDEFDRFRYVREAFRVLRSGGRLSLDNIDLESDAGWNMFAADADRFQGVARPPYTPRVSTASEFVTYCTRTGFAKIMVHRRSPLVIVTAEKP
jgi:SAM-dependent methyltransferase